MKSLTGKFSSARGWAVTLILLFGAGLFVAACGDEEVPSPTTPAPPPAPAPTPPPAPEPEPEPAPEPPAVPVGLRISASGMDFIEWSWNAVEGVSGYDVQYSANEAFTEEDETIARTAEEISYRREGLEAGASAFLRVRAAAGTGEERVTSDWSTHVTGMTAEPEPEVPAAPAAPANLRLKERGSNFIEWEWDEVSGADGYDSQFSTDGTSFGGQAAHAGVGSTSRKVSNLAAETAGHLRVRSYTGSGTGADTVRGDWSASDRQTTDEPAAAVALDAPDGFEATESNDDSILLEWDSVADADFYEVEQRAEDGSWVDASCGGGDGEVDETSCEATGLAEVTEYDFRVRAFPSSSDTQNRESDWTTLNNVSTTGTRPPPPPTTVSGGEDSLNIIWESTDTMITWRWDQVADRSRMYEFHYSEEGYNTDANPCLEPDHADWVASEAGGFATSRIATSTRDSVALLCVQTTWEDDRGVTRYGNHSFAWAATTPAVPALAANSPYEDKDGDTKAIDWQGVTLHRGFQYELRLVPASPTENDNGTSTPAVAPDQEACAAGKELSDEDSGNRAEFTLDAYDVTGLADYTSYHLCYMARNEDGSSHSEWAISSNGGVTLPSQPGSISGVPSSVDHDDGLEWSFAVPADGHPQEASSYNIFLFQEAAEAAEKDPKLTGRRSLNAKDCEATAAIENADGDPIYAAPEQIDSLATRTRTHIRVVVPTGSVTDAETGPSKKNYLCVQSEISTGRVSKWRLSGPVTQKKAPPPLGS